MSFLRRNLTGWYLFSFAGYFTCPYICCRARSAQFAMAITFPQLTKMNLEKLILKTKNNDGNLQKQTKAVNWEMVLSHHPSCDHDHTLLLAKIRLCTRCTLLLVGLLLAVVVPDIIVLSPNIYLATAILLPLPAVVDFTIHELGYWKSSNYWRLVTGLLLGFACGNILTIFTKGAYLATAFLIIWLFFLEFAVAFVLLLAGKLEAFIGRYDVAVRRQ